MIVIQEENALPSLATNINIKIDPCIHYPIKVSVKTRVIWNKYPVMHMKPLVLPSSNAEEKEQEDDMRSDQYNRNSATKCNWGTT